MQMPDKIVLRSVESLIPYARNARTHSDAQVAQIAGSIREFGFTNPVLIDGENGIVAGHGRVLAARKLGKAGAERRLGRGEVEARARRVETRRARFEGEPVQGRPGRVAADPLSDLAATRNPALNQHYRSLKNRLKTALLPLKRIPAKVHGTVRARPQRPTPKRIATSRSRPTR